MLLFKEYNLLAQDQQAQILWLDGVYLELIRQTPKLSVELYSLYDFYVELYFDNITGEPLFLKAFNEMKRLDPYLELIGIEEGVEVNKNDTHSSFQ